MISVRGRVYTDGAAGAIEQAKLKVEKWYLKPSERYHFEFVEVSETLRESDEERFLDWLRENNPHTVEWEVEAETVLLLSGDPNELASKPVHLRLVSSKKVYTGDAYVTAITKIGETDEREILSISLRGTGALRDASDQPGQ